LFRRCYDSQCYTDGERFDWTEVPEPTNTQNNDNTNTVKDQPYFNVTPIPVLTKIPALEFTPAPPQKSGEKRKFDEMNQDDPQSLELPPKRAKLANNENNSVEDIVTTNSRTQSVRKKPTLLLKSEEDDNEDESQNADEIKEKRKKSSNSKSQKKKRKIVLISDDESQEPN